MGKKPDEIQREIALHREQMSSRFERLEDGVREDLAGAVRADVDQTTSTVKSAVGDKVNIEQYAREHPLTTVAGAFGAGIVLGLASESISMPRNDSFERNGRNGKHAFSSGGRGSQSGSLLDDLIGAASGMVSGTVQDELRQFVSRAFGNDQREEASETQAPNGRYREDPAR